MSITRAIIGQINAISDYVTDSCLSVSCLSVVEMQKILDALEDAHFQISSARERIKRGDNHPDNEGMFG